MRSSGPAGASALAIASIVLLLAMIPAAIAVAADTEPELGPATLADTPLYQLHTDGTLQRSENGGGHWLDMRGLPTRFLPEARAGEALPVTAVCPDPSDTRRVLAAVGKRLFLSTSAGARWEEVDLGSVINRSTYITAIAIDPADPDHWVVGTSYDGIYVSHDAGSSWTDLTGEWRIPELYRGAGFFGEIAAVEIENETDMLVLVGMGGGMVRIDSEAREAVQLRPVTDPALAYSFPDPHGAVRVAGPNEHETTGANPATAAESEAAAARRRVADDKAGIYVAAANATPELIGGYLDLAERHGFNSIVVDLKDDYGRLTYETGLTMPRTVGAVEVMIDLPELLREAHRRGIYVIARVVLFKDRALYRYDNHRFALWDSVHERPWGVFRTITDEETGESRTIQVEHWVDPWSAEVREYNIAIAGEIASLGVDEIQFDYVRFPSDGRAEHVVSPFAPEDADRVQALEAFLSAARAELDVPVSVDVFGFNAWSRMSYLGQDITRLSQYVDVICPMFYPSHFASTFLSGLTVMERSEVIYDVGTRRARLMAGSVPAADPRPADGTADEAVLIRPWAQAFLIGAELEYEEDEYYRYLELQLEGAEKAAADGFSLWNASGRYYMVR